MACCITCEHWFYYLTVLRPYYLTINVCSNQLQQKQGIAFYWRVCLAWPPFCSMFFPYNTFWICLDCSCREWEAPYFYLAAFCHFFHWCLFGPWKLEQSSIKKTTHHIICGDDFFKDLWWRALRLQVWVLVTEVKQQQGAVVRSSQSRGKGQDALL